MAIAYVWITEGRYDKEYVAAKTIGFDEFKDYILAARGASLDSGTEKDWVIHRDCS